MKHYDAKGKIPFTQHSAEQVEDVLRKSAASLIEAKESMIIALLEQQLHVEMISEVTATPVEKILDVQKSLGK